MKKIPFKWKLFLIFSYIQLLFWGVVCFFFTYTTFRYSSRGNPYAAEDFLYMFLFAFFFLVILLNNFLNINVVHRYFPDTPVSGKTKSLMKIAGILAAICWLFLFLVSVYGLSKELSAPKENYDKAGIIIAIVLLFMWLLGLYTFIMQLGIFKSLNRASNQKINSLIDSIGTQ